MEGKLLSTQTLIPQDERQEISLEGLPPGLYIIQAFDDLGRRMTASKLVKL